MEEDLEVKYHVGQYVEAYIETEWSPSVVTSVQRSDPPQYRIISIKKNRSFFLTADSLRRQPERPLVLADDSLDESHNEEVVNFSLVSSDDETLFITPNNFVERSSSHSSLEDSLSEFTKDAEEMLTLSSPTRPDDAVNGSQLEGSRVAIPGAESQAEGDVNNKNGNPLAVEAGISHEDPDIEVDVELFHQLLDTDFEDGCQDANLPPPSPAPENVAEKKASVRFAVVDDGEMEKLQRASKSDRTNKQTAWGVKILQEKTCDPGDGAIGKELERCVREGERFVNRYLRNIRRGRKNFNVCESFATFTDCLDPLVARCPHVTEMVATDWRAILDQMSCACNNKSQDCVDVLECFEGQYAGVLARRCDAYYRFNVQQKTRHRCQFIAENVGCKQALIRSGCGEASAQFAFRMSILSSQKTIKNSRCQLKDNMDYRGFKFDAECPTDFADRLESCRSKSLRSRQRLIFHDQNDLVVRGDKEDVKKACELFHDYSDCVSPVREKCPTGAEMYLEHESRLRTYLMKVDYICDKAYEDYSSSTECYISVLQKKNLTQCDYIFVSLKPVLQKVTAFQFYCKPGEKSSSELQDHLDHLRQCYEDVFSRSCNGSGGSAMSGLIREVFNDPFYLRYKYKPNCALHSIIDPTTPRNNRAPDRTGRDMLVASGGGTVNYILLQTEIFITMAVWCLFRELCDSTRR